MGIHHIIDGKVVEYVKKITSKEKDIEDYLEKHIEILDKDIFIIGRQVPTATKTRIDLMGLDRDGNVVIIEIKKGVSEREVVSQILEYGVWAESIQYEDLNRIAKDKHLKDFQDLYKKYESDFKLVPDPFNRKQRLYIVAEKIDKKIEDVTRYLKIRGMDIKCVELNFHEDSGHELAHTKVIVGDEETIYQEFGDDSKTEQITWSDKLELTTPQNKKRVFKLISNIQQNIECRGEPHNKWYYLHTKKNGKHFAVIICGKDSARIAFRVNPATFNMGNEEINSVRGWFFPKDAERRISVISENEELIIQCLNHAYDTTMEYSSDEKERQSASAHKAWDARREKKGSSN